jgi:hypothetical protein
MEKKLTKQQTREMISRKFMERQNLKFTNENFRAMKDTFLGHELRRLWDKAGIR